MNMNKNPFDTPHESFDVTEFFSRGPNKIENTIREFFCRIVNEELNSLPKNSKLKVYQINRFPTNKNNQKIEIIQAYCQAQATYLYLLHETKSSDSYPFTEHLEYCTNMELLTPYDVYNLMIHCAFDTESSNNEYLSEINQFILLYP